MNCRMILAGFGGLLAAAGILTAQPAHADTIDDMALLQVMDSYGITYTNATAAIAAGHTVCDLWATGRSLYQVVAFVVGSSNLTPDSAAYFIGAATEAYCPQYNLPTRGTRA